MTNYIPGYMSKGNKGSSEYAAIWRHMVKDASPDDSLKKLVRQLLIKICGNDFPRRQVLFMLSGGKTAGKQHGALRHTNAMFERFSLTGSRRIRTAAITNTASAQASTKDKYKARDPKHEALSPYNWLRRDSTSTNPRVPPQRLHEMVPGRADPSLPRAAPPRTDPSPTQRADATKP